MGRLILGFLFLTAATWVWAQNPEPQTQITVGTGYYQPDITGVYHNFEPAAYGQSDRFAPSVNWNGKYSYQVALGPDTTLNASLADDGWYGFYTSQVSNRAGERFQNAGLLTPKVGFAVEGYRLDLSFPMYYYGPATAGGYNQLIYAYKEAANLPIPHANSTDPKDVPDTGVVFTARLQVTQRFQLDRTTWISVGVGGLLALNPVIWPTYVMPQFSLGFWGIELDNQYDLFQNYNDGNSFVSTFFEEKLSYDLGYLSFVPGLKPYTLARLSFFTTNPAYIVNGTAQAFHNSYWELGLAYDFPFSGGTLSVTAGWRFDRFTDVGTANNDNSGTYSDPATNVNDQAPYSELRTSISYTFGP